MKKQLFSIAALLATSFATAAGGMVFTENVNNVRPDHPSLNGTYWGWQYLTNFTNEEIGNPTVYDLNYTEARYSYLDLHTQFSSNQTDPDDPGTAGYRVFARRDPSIDFRLGSSIRANIRYSVGHHIVSESPVPGMMIGIQDSRGYFFGIGFGGSNSTATRFVRIITNPFTGAGSDWIPIPVNTSYFHDLTSHPLGYDYDIELVIAGSRASIVTSGRKLKDSGGNFISVDAGTPLVNLIFSHWINHGGVIVGDYSTTSSGGIGITSLSYY